MQGSPTYSGCLRCSYELMLRSASRRARGGVLPRVLKSLQSGDVCILKVHTVVLETRAGAPEAFGAS